MIVDREFIKIPGAMSLRLFCLLSLLLATNASVQRCPEKCNCTHPNSEVECTSLDITPFGLEIFKLKIVSSEELKLSYEVFRSLGLESLNYLHIESSTIVELNKDAFARLPLSEIVIRNSSIPEIPALLFEPLSHLRLLDLSNNKLTNFVGIQSNTVRQLSLSGCGIRKIKQACLNCALLSYLDLSYNQIEEMSNTLGVDYLNVSHNKIKTVDFKEDINLATLDLSYNPIEKIVGDADVEKLILKSCGLTDLSFLQDFSLLTYLDVSDNKLRNISREVFSNLIDLQNLVLSNNKLTSLDNDVFLSNTRLSKLILDGNFLKTLPKFVSSDIMLHLNFFSCDNCGIEILNEDTFIYAPTIITISLRNNHITKIEPKLFQFVPSLVRLDLTNNSLTSIGNDCFRKNSDLKNVVLVGNPLQRIDPAVFGFNKFLKNLDISNCKLDKLWDNTNTKIPSLSALYAGHNLIKSISVEELDVTKKLSTLILDGNPFNCDKFGHLHKWVLDKNVLTLGISDKSAPDSQIPRSWVNECDVQTQTEPDNNYDDYYDDTKEDVKSTEEDDFTKDIEDYATEYTEKPEITIPAVDLSHDTDVNDQFREDTEDTMDVESNRFKDQPRRQIIVFLLPTLVFVLTALIVLVLTVTAILCILYKRNKKPNAPQINIIPWSSSPKIKKHSGSVYRPLSEEKIPV